MHSRILPSSALFMALALTACGWSNPNGGTTASEGSESSSAPLVTHNVSYTGIVEELGISIYMQGTHKLQLSDGRFILLVASDANLNLNSYLGKHVEVRGSVQPTIEGGATIMSVEQVTVLAESMSASTSSAPTTLAPFCGGIAGLPCSVGFTCVDDPTDSCDPSSGGADCGGICIAASEVSSESSFSSSRFSSSRSSALALGSAGSVASSPPALSSSSEEGGIDPAKEQQIVTMASQNYDASLWTQKYCTSHIAFCIPVHKNWYYTSFGSKTTSLWHVEFGMGPIENLGDGVILLNLADGLSSAAGGADGTVRTTATEVVGYRDWDGKHFEITADVRLSQAVEYMITHMEQYVPAE